ncbi:Resistance protein [Quillaja saponaria]|uniref:ADP-ribosyl cyclase/cyclic ADP-ribose hydrolase n=1 Tax=Quillaja saponaria TaxID=32244 RepID=A0AAD7LP73_QUISA|nr:Resistance protein [Quillaja saponaria]
MTEQIVDSSTEKWNYNVFLSFRGEDTRNKFLGHLYEELTRRGIQSFKDDMELKRGAEISPALLKAVWESRISIIIFSKHYASSSWCLEELVHIIKCRREKKQFVLPVFYEVEPTEIRKHQSGSFGHDMAKHEKEFESDKMKVDNWKLALEEAADLAGVEFKNGYWQGQ